MKIAIIGAGSVGSALAEACARLGHDVQVGVRDPRDPKRSIQTDRLASIAAAMSGADVVVLAVPATALVDLLGDLQLDLEGSTVVVDATNAVAGPAPGGFSTVGGYVRSVVDPSVPVVKAFNTIGAEHMVEGRIDGTPVFLPVAGDKAGLDMVLALARDIGFEAVPVGGVESIALVEDHARLWIHLMRSGWGRDFGFAVVGRPHREEQT